MTMPVLLSALAGAIIWNVITWYLVFPAALRTH